MRPEATFPLDSAHHRVWPLLALLVGCAEPPRTFDVWATSCAHVPADLRQGRKSLELAIRQSEGRIPEAPPFAWDIQIDAGDLSSSQVPPVDVDGVMLARQYAELEDHRREQIYNVAGNHDSPYLDHGPGSWFRRWGDPLGELPELSGVHAEHRPFPVEGTWERYRFEAGNVLFLMLADRNDVPSPVGRGTSVKARGGGFPAGAVTRETFDWWRQQVLDNQDRIIVTVHHHMLQDTTTASGKGEGFPRYHGASGDSDGASSLYYLIEDERPGHFEYTADARAFESFLEEFHAEHDRGAIDMWVGGHTHVMGPEDRSGGKGITERRWGVSFLQTAALTAYHQGGLPMSRLLGFTEGEEEARARVYVHEPWHGSGELGFSDPAERRLPLRHPFEAPAPVELAPDTPPASLDAGLPDKPHVRGSLDPHGRRDAGPLLAGWDPDGSGEIDLAAALAASDPPQVNAPARMKGGAHRFDGRHSRIVLGEVDVGGWSELAVTANVARARSRSLQRIVSMDIAGQRGVFILSRTGDLWRFQVADTTVDDWRVAEWEGKLQTPWHDVTGIVDGARDEIRLVIDGKVRARAPWKAPALPASPSPMLVVGADSGRHWFSQPYQGRIHRVWLRRASTEP